MVRLQSKPRLFSKTPIINLSARTVEDDIAFGLENINFPHEGMQEKIELFAKEVGMYDYLKKEPSNLSVDKNNALQSPAL